MAKEQDPNYEKALKNAEKLLQTNVKLTKQSEENQKIWDKISGDIFGLASADFFKEVPKTRKEIAESAKAVGKLKDTLKESADSLDEVFGKLANPDKIQKAFDAAGVGLDKLSSAKLDIIPQEKLKEFKEFQKDTEGFRKKLEDSNGNLSQDNEDLLETFKKQLEYQEDMLDITDKRAEVLADNMKMSKESKELFLKQIKLEDQSLANSYLEAVATGKIGDFIERNGKAAADFNQRINDGNKELTEAVYNYNDISKNISASISEQEELNKKVLTFEKQLEKIGTNTLRKIKDGLLEYDQILSDAQMTSGIMMKGFDQASGMQNLTAEAAKFNMTAKDGVEMMTAMGDQLRTTDFKQLNEAANDFMVISKATGIAADDIATIAGELMRAGTSSADVRQSMEDVSKTSQKMGVNAKNVLKQISANVDKMRQFGFTGGVESLREMAVEAERLRINVDDIFNVAERARSIEGAMEMAAELQLAGGSFSNINPMDLLSAARKGPKEMSDILTQMGKDIGSFNENGEFEIDPVDADRLRMVAESTGMSYDSLSKMIQKTASDTEKLKQVSGDGFFNASPEDQKMLAEMTSLDENMKIQMDEDSKALFKQAGITDLSMITDTQMKSLIELKEGQSKSLDDQAKLNQSLTSVLESFSKIFMSLFTIFEPILSLVAEGLAEFAIWLSDAIQSWGDTTKYIVGGLATVAMTLLAGFTLFGGFVGKFVKGIASMAKKAASGAMNLLSKKEQSTADSVGKSKGGGGLSSLAKSIADASKEGKEIKLGGIAKLAGAFVIFGGIVGGAMWLAVQSMSEEDLKKMLMLGGVLLEVGITMALVSKAGEKLSLKGIGMLSLAFAAIGVGLGIFAYAAGMLSGDIDWTNVLIALGVLTGVVLAMAALGSVAMAAAPLILAGAAIMGGAALALWGLAELLGQAAPSFNELAQVDWSGFSNMGQALLDVVPGLLGFGLAAMAFANPIALVGLGVMAVTLMTLNEALSPLASTLTEAGEGFKAMAEGIGMLQAAAETLDMEKIETLAAMSDDLAGVAEAGRATGGGGGGGSSSSSQMQTVRHVHEVNIKMNGREMQKLIIDDTELQ